MDLEEDTGFKIKPEVLNSASNVNGNSLEESPRAPDPTNDIKIEIEEEPVNRHPLQFCIQVY